MLHALTILFFAKNCLDYAVSGGLKAFVEVFADAGADASKLRSASARRSLLAALPQSRVQSMEATLARVTKKKLSNESDFSDALLRKILSATRAADLVALASTCARFERVACERAVVASVCGREQRSNVALRSARTLQDLRKLFYWQRCAK